MGLYIEAILLIAAGICTITQGNVFTNPLARIARFDPMHNECGIDTSDREGCGKRLDMINKDQCLSRGCCYDDRDRVEPGTIRCFLPKRMLTPQCDVDYKNKDDCGYTGILEGECVHVRNCCYKPSGRINDPDCFHPKSLRLINEGEEDDKEGRVEIRINVNGEWGTVCDDGFGIEEADVVCISLGYAGGVPKIEAHYGEGSGQIWLDDLECNGDELKLEDCRHRGIGSNNCGHSEDAGVQCYNEGESTSGDGDEYDWYDFEAQSKLKPGKKKGKKNKGKKKKFGGKFSFTL